MSLAFNWVAFVAYCLIMLYIGYKGMVRTKDADDYYVAGRSFNIYIAVPLFAASFISSASMVGFTSYAYSSGWSMLVLYGAGLAGGWIMLQLFAPKLYSSTEKWLTTPDLYSARYYDEKFMRPFMAIFNIFYMIVYIVIGIMGVGTVMEVFLKMPYHWAVLILGIVFLTYTTLGGMFSVAWTNVVQWLMLTVCILVTAAFALTKAGGLTSVNEYIFSVDSAMHSPTVGGKLSLFYIFGLAIGNALNIPCLVYYHRIFFSLDSKRTAKSYIAVSAVFLIITYFAILFIGLAARKLLPDLANPSQAFPQIIMMMPFSIGAIAVAGIISAVQSTIDSQLLSAGSMAAHDVYNRILKPDATTEQVMSVSRWLTLLCGIIAVVTALIRPTGLMNLYNLIIVVGPTVLFPPLFLGLFWKRTTKPAGIFGVVFGLVAGIAWVVFGPKSIPATLIILPASLIAMIIISLNTTPPPSEIVKKFFPA
ncbi:sodium:solute symporter family protein [Petroclostridium sp. X23]|uniref:sodium:solute symporter family protein n=1 Tax=Petroclostridium sp. X23 TaxID=3045146 RepID=UPI0024AE10F6|nr:sodium:solute symporter family protein [Petroclostridium sp. X23]WHH60504.1 sodium:solute symporter family protein [Petroclostridium sp. X23]